MLSMLCYHEGRFDISTQEDFIMDRELTKQFLEFLDNSPSCYHVVDNLKNELLENGYVELQECERWNLQPEGKYFVIRGESALLAFRIPKEVTGGFMMAAAHTDSPTFQLKQEAEILGPGNTLRLSVEPYGGMISRSWLDRPLSVAGRVMVDVDGDVVSRHIYIDRDLLVIPSVAIHMDREVNKGVPLNPAVDMLPLAGNATEKGAFKKLVAEAAGVKPEEILSTELFLTCRAPATLLGLEEEFIAAPKLDDLECVFACLKGFLAAEESGAVPVFCAFDNEEVGSATRKGADSTFLTGLVESISEQLGRTPAEHLTAVARSFMVSADNAHAIHPAHPEYADKTEAPAMNGGIVIKQTASQRYTTDSLSAALFRMICRKADVPVQMYSNRADLPGGSTLGNISTSHLSVPAVDIGLAQLAMHASYEVAGTKDLEYMVRAMTTYFGCDLHPTKNGATGVW